jgi:tetratricopeptide (TPR) repeat protein
MADEKNQEKSKQKQDIDAGILMEGDTVQRAEAFVKKYKYILSGAVIILIAGGFGLTMLNSENQEKEREAQQLLYPLQSKFEADSARLKVDQEGRYVLLEGSDTTIGLDAITKEYSGTKAANLANYYAGIVDLQSGNFERAIDEFEIYDAEDLLSQGRKYQLIGDANLELYKVAEEAEKQAHLDEAISSYKKAIKKSQKGPLQARYMLKLGKAYEVAAQKEEAKKSYADVIATYSYYKTMNSKKYDNGYSAYKNYLKEVVNEASLRQAYLTTASAKAE